MRSIIETEKSVDKEINMDELAKFLNSSVGVHIEEVYFTENEWYLVAYEYKSKGDKKPKLYHRLKRSTEDFINSDGAKMTRATKIGLPEYEIIRTMYAEDIVKDYALKIKNLRA